MDNSQFTTEQRIFVVKHMVLSKGCFTAQVKQEFARMFPLSKIPHRNTARELFKRFNDTGSVGNYPMSGRKPISDEMAMGITDSALENPTTSTRRIAQQVGCSQSTVCKTLKKEKYRPYKVSRVQKLLAADKPKRIEFCNWLNDLLTRHGPELMNQMFFSDEAWVYLTGNSNKQNSRVWAIENPHAYEESFLHVQKIGVWCAMSRKRIIGPVFFENTITADRYRTDILEPFIAQLTDDEIDYAWFQQDGASAHTANASLEFLEQFFADRIISRGIPEHQWPPRSPDLSPLDFHLWGFLKENIFKDKPETLDDLKQVIETEIQKITPATLEAVFDNMVKRINLCRSIAVAGGHFQQLMKHRST